jgi:hypothetical protein
MITNSGKSVIAKYLLGQVTSYATHIAIGCGQEPLGPTDSMPSNIEQKEILDFEMVRVPITSRGFVQENGETKISLTAELPNENRYEITEVGLWSSGSNTLARQFDSRIIFNFQENWQAHNTSVFQIPVKSTLGTGFNIEDGGDKVFIASSGDKVLETQDRISRNEGPRFLNRSIFLRGDSSNIESEDIEITSATSNGSILTYLATNDFDEGNSITISSCSNELFNVVGATVVSANSSSFTISRGVAASEVSSGGVAWRTGSWEPEEDLEGFVSTHIHLVPISFNINRNNPRDELALAFSVIDKNSDGSSGNPDFVKILIEFYRNEVDKVTGFSKAELYIDSGSLVNNRYKIIRFPISDLITSTDFSSSDISVARVFAAVYVEDDGDFVVSDDHYVALDALRLDNVSTQNPLYKMVGYSPTITPTSSPIIKAENTNNYVEFRFGLGVV